MKIFRLSGSGAAVASVLSLTACGTSTPIVGSGRATPQHLVADLQSVGSCLGDVDYSTEESQVGLEALSDVTLGSFTDTRTMYAEFCKALNG